MSGVFLSYSRTDRALADRVVRGLRALGADVWWDEDMPGVDWRDELERQLSVLSAVLVIWTPTSSGSRNVMAEARLGDRKEKLINVVCGVSSPPPPFDAINGLPLNEWTGRDAHNGWTRLVRTVEDFLVRSGDGARGHLTSALVERERTIREQRSAVAVSVDAYQAAQLIESEAAEAEARASEALAAAEEQLRWMVERRASPAVMRAAQTEIDHAVPPKAQAEATRRTASAALGRASRAMALAKADLERLFDDGVTLPPPVVEPARIEPEHEQAPQRVAALPHPATQVNVVADPESPAAEAAAGVRATPSQPEGAASLPQQPAPHQPPAAESVPEEQGDAAATPHGRAVLASAAGGARVDAFAERHGAEPKPSATQASDNRAVWAAVIGAGVLVLVISIFAANQHHSAPPPDFEPDVNAAMAATASNEAMAAADASTSYAAADATNEAASNAMTFAANVAQSAQAPGQLGLVIEQVAASPSQLNGDPAIYVSGQVRNETTATLYSPRIRFALLDSQGGLLAYAYTPLPSGSVAPLSAAPFSANVTGFSPYTATVVTDFEPLPAK